MNNDNLSPSSSQNQVQKSREPFPTRYYYAFEYDLALLKRL